MRRLTAWLLMAWLPMAVLLFGAPLSAEAEADTMDVMDVILSMKTDTPDLDVLKNCAILARQRYGQAIRRIDYRWDAGRFSAQVTVGSTRPARTPLKDAFRPLSVRRKTRTCFPCPTATIPPGSIRPSCSSTASASGGRTPPSSRITAPFSTSWRGMSRI